MLITMPELVTILGQEKALELTRRYPGGQVPASSSVDRYSRDQEVRRLWSDGIALSTIAERLCISYRTALRAVRKN